MEYPDPEKNKPAQSHLKEYENTMYSQFGLEQVECWNCLEEFDEAEELYMNVVAEPDGYIHACKHCDAEYEIRVGFKVSPLYNPNN